MTTDPVRAIADAVLYEGYVLWPYSRSALKNQRRWTFGGVYPAAHAREHPDDPSLMRTDCLLEAPADARVDVCVRFLQVVRRAVLEEAPGGQRPVDELVVDGERYLAWEEAVEREITLAAGEHTTIDIPAGAVREDVRDARGRRRGTIVRCWRRLQGAVRSAIAPVEDGVLRVVVEVANTTPCSGVTRSRARALERTFCSTHTVLRCRDGAFVSMTDPPAHLRAPAAECENVGTWPVLAGEEGDRATVLSSPIILEDHPRVAPESPGDLFDGGEIDQLLTLSILTLTDEERAQMRAADPRTREILERTERLTPEQLMQLHGRLSDLRGVLGP